MKKRAIEFEEVVKIHHQIVIEYKDEEILNDICELSGNDFEEIVQSIDDTDGVSVIGVIDNYSEDSEGIEYYDDYWTKQEVKFYGVSED